MITAAATQRISINWAPGMVPLGSRPAHERQDGEIVALWMCPVCTTPCHRRHQSGRARVYCTNACRQRAYRHRCAQRAAGQLRPGGRPPERSRTRDCTHALRPRPDFIAGRRDSTGRQITACGAFSKADSESTVAFWHTEFMTGGPCSCKSCARLLRVPDIPIEEVVERALAHAASLRRLPHVVG